MWSGFRRHIRQRRQNFRRTGRSHGNIFRRYGCYKAIAHLAARQEKTDGPADFPIRIVTDAQLQARHVLESISDETSTLSKLGKQASQFPKLASHYATGHLIHPVVG